MTCAPAVDIHAHFFPESFLRLIDMGYERPRDIITKHARLRPADQARILGGNAVRLLRVA